MEKGPVSKRGGRSSEAVALLFFGHPIRGTQRGCATRGGVSKCKQIPTTNLDKRKQMQRW